MKKTKPLATKDADGQFYYLGILHGYKSSQRLLDRHLLHQPSKVTLIERVAFLLGGENVFLTRLHRDISDEIDFKVNNLDNDMP